MSITRSSRVASADQRRDVGLGARIAGGRGVRADEEATRTGVVIAEEEI